VIEVIPQELAASLARALGRISDEGIPTPFLFVYDQAWEVAQRLRPAFDALMGAPTYVLPDVWAWFLRSKAGGAGGWAPHRGVRYDVRDAQGAPTLMNAWIALTDVTEANACMYVVPLPKDPSYPGALDAVDVDPSLATPLPVPAGGLVAWNANVLHWGGRMQSDAPPRASLSFSIATAREPPPPASFDARLDLVAEMLLTYKDIARVDAAWIEWASLWRGLRTAQTLRPSS